MSEDTQRSEMAKKVVVLELPGVLDVIVHRDVPYGAAQEGAAPRVMDVYRPRGAPLEAPPPVVVFVSGFPDPGGRLKQMGAYTSWGRLVAVSGMVAITYTNRAPLPDLSELLAYLRDPAHATALGIDPRRVGVWAGSGNVPAALAALAREPAGTFACAALCYGYMIDRDGSTAVAAAAKAFGFVDATAGLSIDALPPELPLLLVRAGQDQMPGLNSTIDRFVADALARNLPLTVEAHATGPHAFELFDDSAASRALIGRILAFLRFHLRA
jgi:hypothetical protein